MVTFDTNVLSLLLFPDAKHQVENAAARVAGLLAEIEATREQIVVPTPVLAEILVTDGVDVHAVLETLRNAAYLRVESFDERAAVELATRLAEARRSGNHPNEGLKITKDAMKFDRQIVAIALVTGSRVLYSDDDGVAKFARGCNLPVVKVQELPVPARQEELFPPNSSEVSE